jgi:hypothetical protein
MVILAPSSSIIMSLTMSVRGNLAGFLPVLELFTGSLPFVELYAK